MKQKERLEQSFADLEKLVQQMESKDLNLEESLALFEKGIHLINHCRKTLLEAEQKVKKLAQEMGEGHLEETIDQQEEKS